MKLSSIYHGYITFSPHLTFLLSIYSEPSNHLIMYLWKKSMEIWLISYQNHSKLSVSINWLRDSIDWYIQSFLILSFHHQCWDSIALEHTFGMDFIWKYVCQALPIDFHNVPIDRAYIGHPPWCILGLVLILLLFCIHVQPCLHILSIKHLETHIFG